jgi:hypothetical protein
MILRTKKVLFGVIPRLWAVYYDILDKRRSDAVAIVHHGCSNKHKWQYVGCFPTFESKAGPGKVDWNTYRHKLEDGPLTNGWLSPPSNPYLCQVQAPRLLRHTIFGWIRCTTGTVRHKKEYPTFVNFGMKMKSTNVSRL